MAAALEKDEASGVSFRHCRVRWPTVALIGRDGKGYAREMSSRRASSRARGLVGMPEGTVIIGIAVGGTRADAESPGSMAASACIGLFPSPGDTGSPKTRT